MKRVTRFVLAIIIGAIFGLLLAPEALSRGGSPGGRGPGAGAGGNTPRPSKSPKAGTITKAKRSLEAARERLRQADRRGRDAGSDRGAV